MSSSAKKITMVSIYYLVALFSLTLIVLNSHLVTEKVNSLIFFYLVSLVFALIVGYYLFKANVVDIHHKTGAIESPSKRDVTKRKVLAISFFYSSLFILMFLFNEISFFVFAFWPIMVFLGLLLLFDRRLIFNVTSKVKITNGQKYSLRFLISLAVLSSMWYLHEFISRKPMPTRSSLVLGWEFIDICIWCLPIFLITALIIADWLTLAIHHVNYRQFFKRPDVILFGGIQFIIIIFLLLV
jgi:hypothetical protein